jgi:excisionase family DNA binding protein
MSVDPQDLLARLDRLTHALEQQKRPDGPDFLSIAQVAKRLSVDQRTVRGLLDSGALPSYRVGVGSRRIRVEDYEAFRGRVEPWRAAS